MSEPERPDGPQVPPDATPDLSHTTRQVNNPLHGVTLEMMLRDLVAHYGWPGLAQRIVARCFANEPNFGSSLKFLRRTPWARSKVESLYLFMRREQARRGSPRS